MKCAHSWIIQIGYSPAFQWQFFSYWPTLLLDYIFTIPSRASKIKRIRDNSSPDQPSRFTMCSYARIWWYVEYSHKVDCTSSGSLSLALSLSQVLVLGRVASSVAIRNSLGVDFAASSFAHHHIRPANSRQKPPTTRSTSSWRIPLRVTLNTLPRNVS